MGRSTQTIFVLLLKVILRFYEHIQVRIEQTCIVKTQLYNIIIIIV